MNDEMKPDGRKKNKTAFGGKKRTHMEEERKKKKKCCECQAKSQESAPFHTIAISIPKRRKRKEERRSYTPVAVKLLISQRKSARKESGTSLDADRSRAVVDFQRSSQICLVVFISTWQFSHRLVRNISPHQVIRVWCDTCDTSRSWKTLISCLFMILYSLIYPTMGKYGSVALQVLNPAAIKCQWQEETKNIRTCQDH